jgi:hypothetical protein
MFRTTLILTSAAAVAVAVSACGVRIETDGSHTVQTRTVGAFDRVDLRGSTDVVVTHGRTATLTVSGGRNRVRDVITRVQSGTLVVEQRDPDATLQLGDDGPTVTVSTPSLVGARIDGSGDLSVAGLTSRARETCRIADTARAGSDGRTGLAPWVRPVSRRRGSLTCAGRPSP